MISPHRQQQQTSHSLCLRLISSRCASGSKGKGPDCSVLVSSPLFPCSRRAAVEPRDCKFRRTAVEVDQESWWANQLSLVGAEGGGGRGRSYKCDCVSQVARLSANLVTALVHCGVLGFFSVRFTASLVQMDVFTCDRGGGPRRFRSIHSGCFHCLPRCRSAWVWICLCKLFIRSGCVYKEKPRGSSCRTTVEFPSVNPARTTLLVPFPLVCAGLNMRRSVSLFTFLSARVAQQSS